MSGSPRRRGLGERGLTALSRQLSPRDVAVLDTVAAHRFITTRQVQALLFDGHASAVSGARVCHRVLARLARDGLLARPERRVGGLGAGSSSAIWRLSPSGVRLRRLRAGEGTAWRSGYVEPGTRFIQHYLAVGDCHVTLVQAGRQRRLELLELQLEPACWRHYSGLGGGRLVLKPDLYAVTAPVGDGETPADFEDHWFIEVDLGTESLRVVFRQCQLYDTYRRQGIEQQKTGTFPLVVWIMPSHARAAKLQAVLRQARNLDRSLFQVTTAEQFIAHIAGDAS